MPSYHEIIENFKAGFEPGFVESRQVELTVAQEEDLEPGLLCKIFLKLKDINSEPLAAIYSFKDSVMPDDLIGKKGLVHESIVWYAEKDENLKFTTEIHAWPCEFCNKRMARVVGETYVHPCPCKKNT